jgi:DNA-binding NarL/FixJ family response regulator
MNERIKVALIDDDQFVRSSLSTILSAHDDIEICGEGGDGNEAIALFAASKPDILLMDIQMPGCDGLEAGRIILESNPEARIVFLTTFSSDEYIKSALHMGSKGYLIKSEVSQIVPALSAVMAGQVVLGSEVLSKMDALLAIGQQPTDTEPAAVRAQRDGLTECEFEVLELIAQGYDNKEIAAKLYRGEGTVRNHVSTILQKLVLKNRTQLAKYYYHA